MFTKKFEEHKKKGLHKLLVPMAAGSAAGFSTKKYWLKQLLKAHDQHEILKKTHGPKAKIPYKKMMGHMGKGVGTLMGSVAAANLGTRYVIDKLEDKKK